MKRKVGFVSIILLMMILLCGCYKTVRTPEQLYKKAKSKYGDCTVLSEKQEDSYSEIVVRDEKQNFEYKVYCDNVQFIDGSVTNVFGVYDNFEESYTNYVIQETKSSCDDIASKYGITYETDGSFRLTTTVYSDDEDSALKAANEIMDCQLEYNYKKRLKECKINLVRLGGNSNTARDCYGTLNVSTGCYKTTEEQLIDYYYTMLKIQINARSLRFVMAEYNVPIEETGADWDKVYGGKDWNNYQHSISEGEFCDRYTFKVFPFGGEYQICSFEYITDDGVKYYVIKK